VKVNGTLYAFFDGKLHRTTDGLSYSEIELGGIATEPKFVAVANTQLLIGRISGISTSWRLVEGQWFRLAGTPDVTIEPEQLGLNDSGVVLLAEESNELRAFVLAGDEWRLSASVTCSDATGYFNSVRLGAVCVDGSNWIFTAGVWQPLIGEPVEFRSNTSELILMSAKNLPSRLFVDTGATTAVIDLPSDPTSYFAVGDRILLSLGASGLHELLWQLPSPELVAIAPTFTNVVEAAADAVLVSAGTTAYISTIPGQWSAVTSVGDFNHATRVPTGIWVWQTNAAMTSGGLAQFLPTGQSGLTKVNPWSSTTSPIQATSLQSLPAYVSVITSSGNGNVNLYRSDNYTTWTRITLPTNPTLVRPIAATRDMPAGTLVEVDGVVSVPSGIVAPDVIYAQDSTGGTQVFLSSSKGVIAHRPSVAVRITGEVSTSQAKRLILDAVDDIVPIGQAPAVEPIQIDYLSADQFMGSLVRLRGTIAELSTDELRFAGDFRFQFPSLGQNIKTIFKMGDTIESIAIVDWNSSTDTVEAWYTGDGYSILDRATAVAPAKSKQSSKSQPSRLTKSTENIGSVGAPSSSKTVVAKSATIRPLIQGARSIEITSDTSSQPLPTTGLTFLGIITGMLAVQGRRMQRLFRS
jgi:hypothetical protein